MELLICVLAAAAAGFSRGFAAFGTAMIFVPLIALVYDAQTAVVTLFLIDLLPSLPLVWKAAPQCDRRTILWMSVGAMALSPLGVMVLLIVDQSLAQLIVGLFLLLTTGHMLLSTAFRLGTGPARSVAAGAVSGFAGGVCGIFGPPAMIYLLGRNMDARTTRADAIVFLTGESLILGATYIGYGMVTAPRLQLSLMLVPIYTGCIWLGAKGFAHTGEATYRRIILWLLLAVSLLITTKAVLALA
ncbi:sulfite exporter TauE/SafE family protein [Neorhizobium sp. NCHU2750]|uniref:sulfite exporter TauE/SafE family protein n=1 Tax=Neorhizobium sp. NCHU2750 TaxID=1825976 RepID=UPI000E756AF8|nr:hypothetical protein NCHU2750_09830 [Neorhizobium sp. NCHU2750]